MVRFNFDYSQTMMMKVDVASPDNNGGCKIFNTFEQVLDKIKVIDILTLGAPKIIYLVGWQYLGHDDRYPAFFEVNEYAKRKEDKNARDSLLWLMNEAKKYNTTVSLHINLSDAYPDSPLWNEYIKNDLILKDAFGQPMVTGTWNGRKAYQVRFAQEYKSGYFQKRVNHLLDILPVKDAGTIHIDAFFVRKGKNTDIKTEKFYRRKMIEYFMSNGIDITSEFIYRERNNGLRLHYGKSDVIGLIPAFWHLSVSQKEVKKYWPHTISGGNINPDIQLDKDLRFLLYGNTHGEGCIQTESGWEERFTKDFALGSVIYFFLNQHKLDKIIGIGKNRKAYFSDGIRTEIKDKKILLNDSVLKENETLCVPVAWKENSWFAWSEKPCTKEIYVPFENARISAITPEGLKVQKTANIKNNKLLFNFAGNTTYEITEIIIKK